MQNSYIDHSKTDQDVVAPSSNNPKYLQPNSLACSMRPFTIWPFPALQPLPTHSRPGVLDTEHSTLEPRVSVPCLTRFFFLSASPFYILFSLPGMLHPPTPGNPLLIPPDSGPRHFREKPLLMATPLFLLFLPRVRCNIYCNFFLWWLPPPSDCGFFKNRECV